MEGFLNNCLFLSRWPAGSNAWVPAWRKGNSFAVLSTTTMTLMHAKWAPRIGVQSPPNCEWWTNRWTISTITVWIVSLTEWDLGGSHMPCHQTPI
jgi:hypothetical protein